MKTLTLDDQTYKRLSAVMTDIMHAKGHDVDYGDAINELINVYQDTMTLSGENAGG